MKFFASRAGKITAVVVGIPTLGAGGLGTYVRYRQYTKPARHVFKSLVDQKGNLILEGKGILCPSTFSIFCRIVYISVIFVPLAVLYMLMSLRESWYRVWLNLLLQGVQRCGPVFVKIGQWACTREDLFSRDFRQVFKRLYNEVDVHSFSETFRILKEELGTDPSDVFDFIDEKTLGSGSIGQVHLAKLKNKDTRVVVKVMHPNIMETIVRDFVILNHIAVLMHRYLSFLEHYNTPALAHNFANHLAAQLDFRIEAENLLQFRANFRRERYVEFPEPLLFTRQILVETFCDGVPADPDFMASLPSHARDVLAGKGLNTWCKMLLRDNFIHGDMHPGNILIQCKDYHEPSITLIDVGLCQQLTEHEAALSEKLIEAFVRWNSDLCAVNIWNMSDRQEYASCDRFKADINQVFKQCRSFRNEGGAITKTLQYVFDAIRSNCVQMDPPYVSLLFSVLVLESFLMSLNPDFNIVRHTAPWLVSEGHISKGIFKNLVKTQRDRVKRGYGIFTGRLGDMLGFSIVADPRT
ncbi:unnamed protein product [Phytomonas sp. Hart1]|nr:unnamed protein product [Phytomonas sp. Hart1]|eukprot:CCW70026.1 unnamed protein product [Phytomonas sp. isolate Hart1]